METPHKLPGAHIESSNIAGSRTVALIRRRSENQQILEHTAGCRGLHQPDGRRITIESFFQIDAAVVAEGRNRLFLFERRLRAGNGCSQTAACGRIDPCSPNS